MVKIVLLTEQAYIHKFFLNKEHLKLSIYYLEKNTYWNKHPDNMFSYSFTTLSSIDLFISLWQVL